LTPPAKPAPPAKSLSYIAPPIHNCYELGQNSMTVMFVSPLLDPKIIGYWLHCPFAAEVRIDTMHATKRGLLIVLIIMSKISIIS
jgi:hypothetical protein